jgi:predicted transcriptional regulator of viral defense system
MDKLIAIAEQNDGLLTSKQARRAGILDSVLVCLAQCGRLERAARGVYRIAHYPQARFSQYREAILWADASKGPAEAVLTHESALAVYGISDANPSQVHITVPKSARLRRERPAWIAIHRDNLRPADVTLHEGLPMTTVARTITDVLHSSGRIDLLRQAIRDARRDGLINDSDKTRLWHQVDQFAHRLDDNGSLGEVTKK